MPDERLMMNEGVRYVQQSLISMGHNALVADGVWGAKTKQAFDETVNALRASIPKKDVAELPWGAKVSAAFKGRVISISNALRMPEDGAAWLMACMAWESGETFSPSVKNMAGSGATGLIQFMPNTAVALGTTVDKLSAMTAEDQLDYVYAYFKPVAGRLKNLGDVYMAILWPAGVGKTDDYVLWSQATRPTTYRQNAGLDVNKDGSITRAECIAKVKAKLDKGYLPENKG